MAGKAELLIWNQTTPSLNHRKHNLTVELEFSWKITNGGVWEI